MITWVTLMLLIALLFGLYTAWNIGANDVANAIGTSVGSGALTLKRAVILAAVLEFSGALMGGDEVSGTVMRGIVDPEIFANDSHLFVYGMLSALLAAGVWLQLASFFGWPVSTTHSIVGAVVGFGAIYGGMEAVHWEKLVWIVSSWVISPLLGGALAFTVFTFLNKQIFYRRHPLDAARNALPWLVFPFAILLTHYIIYEALDNAPFSPSFSLTLPLSLIVGLLASLVMRKIVARNLPNYPTQAACAAVIPPAVEIGLQKAAKHLARAKDAASEDLRFQIRILRDEIDELKHKVTEKQREQVDRSEYHSVEKIFAYLQIGSACMMTFAHGSNDVANAIGPLAAVIKVLQTGSVAISPKIPTWILALGGFGIVVGLATWGWRVIETIGSKITELTPSRGFSAEVGAATTILLASNLGLPISTTHTLVAAVLGVGFARGISALNLNTVRDIVAAWLITIPAGAGLSVLFFLGFQYILG